MDITKQDIVKPCEYYIKHITYLLLTGVGVMHI